MISSLYCVVVQRAKVERGDDGDAVLPPPAPPPPRQYSYTSLDPNDYDPDTQYISCDPGRTMLMTCTWVRSSGVLACCGVECVTNLSC